MKILTGLGLLLVNGIIARLLPPEEMGRYLVLYSLAFATSRACALGLSDFSVRLIASKRSSDEGRWEIPRAIRRVLSTLAWSIVLFIAAGGAATLVTSNIFQMEDATPLVFLLFAAWAASFALRYVLAGIFRGLDHMLLAGLFSGGTEYILLVLAFIAAWVLSVTLSLFQIVALTVVAALISAALAMACLANIVREPVISFRPSGFGDILRQSLPMMAAVFLPQSARQLTIWLVALVGSVAEAAEYGLATRLFQSLSALLIITNLLAAPFVAELHTTSDRRRLKALARTLTTVSALPIIGLLLCVLVFGEHLMALAFGEYYRDAASVVVVLGIGQAVQAFFGLSPMLLMMTGYERALMLVQAVGGAALIGAAALGYGLAGISGVAAAVSSITVLEVVGLAILVRGRLGFWPVAEMNPIAVMRRVLGRL